MSIEKPNDIRGARMVALEQVNLRLGPRVIEPPEEAITMLLAQARRVERYILGLPEPGNDAVRAPREGFDEQTLFKVRDALVGAGVVDQDARDLITAMQNVGILFRERG